MPDANRHPLDRTATGLLALSSLGLLTFLTLSESFHGFCGELVRLASKLLSG